MWNLGVCLTVCLIVAHGADGFLDVNTNIGGSSSNGQLVSLIATPARQSNLMTPGYDTSQDYENGTTYEFLVTTNYVNHTLTIGVVSCDIEIDKNGDCLYDMLFVYDGPDDNSTQIGDAWCCYSTTTTWTTTGNQAYITFTTDDTNNHHGFKLYYESTGVISTTPAPTTTSTTPPTTPSTAAPPDLKSCNSTTALNAIIHGTIAHNSSTRSCPSGSSATPEAFVLAHCSLSFSSSWSEGINVQEHCDTIPLYTPVATFTYGTYAASGSLSGIFLGCLPDGFKLGVQQCDRSPSIIHVVNGGFLTINPNIYYTVQ